MRADRFSPLDPERAAYLLNWVQQFEPDWVLVLPYVPNDKRAGWLALLAFAAEVIGAPARVSNPSLGAIRLQWWREVLEEVFAGVPRQHPVSEALALTLRQQAELRPHLEGMIDGLEPFMVFGDDHDCDAARHQRRPVYGNLADALGGWAESPSGGDGLLLHALARTAPDPKAVPSAEGPEALAKRFSRALAANPSLEKELAKAITAYRQDQSGKLPLPALPLRLITAGQEGSLHHISMPLRQRTALFFGVLRGRV
ncbi:MAG: squalene/phytoene synthase family protein [Pseudomonadota bacterium]